MSRVPVGIVNTGNTCYLNTFFQCLNASQHLRTYLINAARGTAVASPAALPITQLTGRVLTLLNMSAGASESDTDMVLSTGLVRAILKEIDKHTPSYLSVESGVQHDLSELWGWWMDKIHQEHQQQRTAASADAPVPLVKMIPIVSKWGPLHQICARTWNLFHKNATNLDWTRLYEGLIIQQVQCPKCRHCLHNPEPVCYVSLDIPDEVGNGPADTVSLDACFKAFFEKETLDEWRCDHCHTETQAEKIVRFWKAAPVLVVVLKRFRMLPNGHLRKNKKVVRFPMEFHFLPNTELFPRRRGADPTTASYRLMAVGNHYGGIHGGHYNATVKHGDDWWIIDDDHREKINGPASDGAAGSAAYVFVYEKENPV